MRWLHQKEMGKRSSFPPPGAVLVGVGLIVLPCVLAACMSLDQMAPPVEQIATGLVGQQPNGLAPLVKGRKIYLTKCSKCHGIEPIDRYSVDQWEDLLPGMAEEANLSDVERSDLHRYIRTAYGFLQTQNPLDIARP